MRYSLTYLQSVFSEFADVDVDFDDVCVCTMPALCSWHNDRYRTSFTLKDYGMYDCTTLWQVSVPEMLRRAEEFHLGRGVHIPIIPGAQPVLRRLRLRKRLHMLTFRHQELAELTHETVQTHFAQVFHTKRLCGYGCGATVPLVKKRDICAQRGHHLIIEDNLFTARQCAEDGMWVILRDLPWNQCPDRELPDQVVRVPGWGQIGQLLSV